ncbi:hypothetical protein Ahy_B03g061981 isoform A [Arachis hypogaea]|uniref:Vps72/YL1 C-terminal domain-containing protein n=1 Tax=Arachis hypogaea TaxID=3818 RepID=A0A444ZSY7_ARAHY|nr:hypothetical protein Ahy_B03g061981 isoform A [Arachis hypogaea]
MPAPAARPPEVKEPWNSATPAAPRPCVVSDACMVAASPRPRVVVTRSPPAPPRPCVVSEASLVVASPRPCVVVTRWSAAGSPRRCVLTGYPTIRFSRLERAILIRVPIPELPEKCCEPPAIESLPSPASHGELGAGATGCASGSVHKKKRLIFPGKKLPKPKKSKKKQKVLSKLERSPNDDDDDDDEDNDDDDDDKPDKEPVPEEHHDTRDDGGEKIIRKSTRTAVIVRQAERDAIRALQASMKGYYLAYNIDSKAVRLVLICSWFELLFIFQPQTVKKKKEGEEKRMTQEEMLLEAAQTEIMNLRNLERVLAREEEVKRKAIVHKTVYNGPQIRYISKDGYTYLEFIKGSSFHSDIATTPVQYPEQPLCAITGLPAKYRDPKTGLPYATKEAFKEIRQRFAEENANNRKQMAMGILYDSVSGCGFSLKQKRSMVPDKSVHTNFRPYARFRRMPASEDEDSD